MRISKVRKCFATGWTIEWYFGELVLDVECEREEEANRLYHALKAMEHLGEAQR